MKTQQNSTSLGQHGTSAWLVNPLFCWYSMDTLRILAIDASFMQRTAEFVINCCVKIVPLVSMGFWRAVAGEYCTCVRLLYTCFIDVRHTMSCYNQVLVKATSIPKVFTTHTILFSSQVHPMYPWSPHIHTKWGRHHLSCLSNWEEPWFFNYAVIVLHGWGGLGQTNNIGKTCTTCQRVDSVTNFWYEHCSTIYLRCASSDTCISCRYSVFVCASKQLSRTGKNHNLGGRWFGTFYVVSLCLLVITLHHL